MAILRLSILVSLAVGVLSAGAEEPKKPTPKFKLAKDTTFVLEPLDAEGYVDYEAALNKQLMGTTTPESNAVVLLMKCFGPKPDGKELHPDFYQALGIEAPPAEGEYLVEYYPFFKEVLKEDESRRDFLNLEYALRSKPWKPADSPRHAEWLKVNEKPLAQVHEALLRNDFILPLISRHRDGKKGMLAVGSSSVIRSLRDLGTLLPLRAMLRVGEGKTDEAIADVLVLYKLGRHTLRGATLSELNVGTALQAIAISTGMAVLEHGRPTALQALGYRKALKKLPNAIPFADRLDRMERLVHLDSIQVYIRSGYDPREPLRLDRKPKTPKEIERFAASIDWEAVMRKINGWIDQNVAALRIPDRSERMKELTVLDARLKTMENEMENLSGVQKFSYGFGTAEEVRVKQTERMGKVVLYKSIYPLTKVTNSYDRCEQGYHNGIIAAGLAAHFADHKKYPDKLDDLIPKYLAKVPDDVFSGKALIYRKTDAGYLFYSLGINGIDDGGKLLTDEPRGNDLGVRMPRK